MPESDEELETRVHVLKKAMKNAIVALATARPGLLESVDYLLANYVRQHNSPRRDWSPRAFFVTEQSILTAIEIKRRLTKKQLTFLDIREDISNLASLLDHIKDLETPPSAVVEILRSRIRNLVRVVGELAGQLEDGAYVRRTDWVAVSELYDSSENYDADTLTPSCQWARVSLDKIEPQFSLGAGGFGSCAKVFFGGRFPMACKIVFRLRHARIEVAAAEKVFACMTQSRFLCRYFACVPTDDYFISLQEYIRGLDLQKCIKNQVSLPVDVCRVVFAQLGVVVQYIHLKGFMHRDIKPSNIMVMPGCRIKLIDYDTIKICTGKYESGPVKSFTRKTFMEFCDSESVGTLMYIAPEVIQRQRYGRASDWWSIGVALQYAASGCPPFRNCDEDLLRSLIINKKLSSLPFLQDADQQALVRSLMCRDVYKRITDARYHEFKEHPFFKSINWERIEDGSELLQFEPLLTMLELKGDGRWSPRKEFLIIKPRRRKRIVDVDVARQQTVSDDPLLTYVSDTMLIMLERIDRKNEQPSEGDFSDPEDKFYEKVQRPPQKITSYRFEGDGEFQL